MNKIFFKIRINKILKGRMIIHANKLILYLQKIIKIFQKILIIKISKYTKLILILTNQIIDSIINLLKKIFSIKKLMMIFNKIYQFQTNITVEINNLNISITILN